MERITQIQAQQKCRSEGASLVVIDSIEKQAWLDRVVPGKAIWLSLTDHDSDGEWEWQKAHGAVADLDPDNAQWVSGQPDGDGRCVTSNNGWFVDPCTNGAEVVCEKMEPGACFYDRRLHSFYCF